MDVKRQFGHRTLREQIQKESIVKTIIMNKIKIAIARLMLNERTDGTSISVVDLLDG